VSYSVNESSNKLRPLHSQKLTNVTYNNVTRTTIKNDRLNNKGSISIQVRRLHDKLCFFDLFSINNYRNNRNQTTKMSVSHKPWHVRLTDILDRPDHVDFVNVMTMVGVLFLVVRRLLKRRVREPTTAIHGGRRRNGIDRRDNDGN